MTYKTILVHVGADAASATTVKFALSLGAPFGATVIGMGAYARDPYADATLGYGQGETIQTLQDDLDADILAAERAFRSACAGYGAPTIWRTAIENPGPSLIAQSRCADIIVASPIQRKADVRRHADPADLILKCGLPVLLAPPGRDHVQPETILIGWKNSRETRRAISDAMPLLKAAERVVVAQVCESESLSVENELEDVVGRLERHDVTAQWQIFPRLGTEADDDLIEIAKSWSADLLVLGGYGHSPSREWALGGVTRNFLAFAPVPILFSH